MAKSEAWPPSPPKRLDATLVTLKLGCGLKLHRVHDLAFGGSEFNTNTKGNARFSPITRRCRRPPPDALRWHDTGLRSHGDDLP
jgi:hypothetical protein